MSCTSCKLKKGPFKSEKDFVDFKREINALIQNRVLIKLGEIEPKSPFTVIAYKCNFCEKTWTLEVPDQAFRGGWSEKE